MRKVAVGLIKLFKSFEIVQDLVLCTPDAERFDGFEVCIQLVVVTVVSVPRLPPKCSLYPQKC